MTLENPLAYPMKVVVIVDGNRHSPDAICQETPIINRPIVTQFIAPPTLFNLARLYDNIVAKVGSGDINQLSIHLLDNEWFQNHMKKMGDNEGPDHEYNSFATQAKTILYYPKTRCMQIWQQNLPIYENNNGCITRDMDALADSLL